MTGILVCTYEYDLDLENLFSNRLQRKECHISFRSAADKRSLKIECPDDELVILCGILSEILMLDLRYIEITRMVEAFGAAPESKREIIRTACANAVRLMDFESTSTRLENYLSHESTLVLEGFLHYMMQDHMQTWYACVDAAIDEVLLRDEYMELVRLLKAFVSIPSDDIGSVNLILQPDGSCTLTDACELRVDCSPGSEDEMLELMIDIAPERITVYDLSMGVFSEFKKKLKRIFGERVEVFS